MLIARIKDLLKEWIKFVYESEGKVRLVCTGLASTQHEPLIRLFPAFAHLYYIKPLIIEISQKNVWMTYSLHCIELTFELTFELVFIVKTNRTTKGLSINFGPLIGWK